MPEKRPQPFFRRILTEREFLALPEKVRQQLSLDEHFTGKGGVKYVVIKERRISNRNVAKGGKHVRLHLDVWQDIQEPLPGEHFRTQELDDQGRPKSSATMAFAERRKTGMPGKVYPVKRKRGRR